MANGVTLYETGLLRSLDSRLCIYDEPSFFINFVHRTFHLGNLSCPDASLQVVVVVAKVEDGDNLTCGFACDKSALNYIAKITIHPI